MARVDTPSDVAGDVETATLVDRYHESTGESTTLTGIPMVRVEDGTLAEARGNAGTHHVRAHRGVVDS